MFTYNVRHLDKIQNKIILFIITSKSIYSNIPSTYICDIDVFYILIYYRNHTYVSFYYSLYYIDTYNLCVRSTLPPYLPCLYNMHLFYK